MRSPGYISVALSLLATLACDHRTTPSARGNLVATTPRDDRARWQPLTDPFIAKRIRANDSTRCAVSQHGKVACWGEVEPDDDSTAVDRRAGFSTPHILVGIDGAIDVVTEWFYLCVAQRASDGDGRCFVVNDINRPAPRFPQPPVQLVPGQGGICARMRDGSVGCVDLDGKYTATPAIHDASYLTCDEDACCTITPNGVKCFGDSPPKIPTLPTVTELVLRGNMGCARTKAGRALCWGDAAGLSQPAGVRGVGGNDDGVCVIRTDGTLACSHDRTPDAPQVAALAGDCILRTDGAIRCTGSNEHGELGDGSLMLSPVPVQVPGLADVINLNVAHTNACAAKRDGTLWCWGPNGAIDRGRADGAFVTAQYMSACRNTGASIRCGAVMFNGDWEHETIVPKVKVLKTAAMHRDGSLCIVDGGGDVQCRHGMSEGGVDGRWVPLAGPAPVEDIQPLATGFCARHNDGRVSCFVDHRYDNDDDFLDKLPKGKLALVPGINDATQLVTGSGQACAIRKDQTVWCWRADNPKPWEIVSLKGATSLGANERHTCAVVRGEVWCWGDGFRGQLGNGAGTGRIEPARAPVKAKTSFKAVKVGTGRQSTCALDDQGRVWCWGANTYGELGHPRPQHVQGWSKVVGIGPR